MKVGRGEIRVAFDTLSEAEQFARDVKGRSERAVAEIALWDNAPSPSLDKSVQVVETVDEYEEYERGFKVGFGYGVQAKMRPGDNIAWPDGKYHAAEEAALEYSRRQGESQTQYYERRMRDARELWDKGEKSGAWALLGR